uniref:Uncharacterized protein n=1 Tax=Arundo donax TaxID=35708 RepID=A0A0A9GX64_ARUDO
MLSCSSGYIMLASNLLNQLCSIFWRFMNGFSLVNLLNVYAEIS